MAKKGGVNPDNPKSTAWDRLSRKDPRDTVKHRDVFGGQQVDRSRIERPQTKTSRSVISIVVGVFVFCIAWLLYSGIALGASAFTNAIGGGGGDESSSVEEFYIYEPEGRVDNGFTPCWQIVDSGGMVRQELPCYLTEAERDANEPQWHKDAIAAQAAEEAAAAEGQDGAETKAEPSDDPTTLGGWITQFTWLKLMVSLLAAMGASGVLHTMLMRNLAAQNLLKDTADINQFEGDQYIMPPEEIQRTFDYFPNSGMKSGVQASSMISHVMLSNKGLNKVAVARRYKEDVVAEDGTVEIYAGEIMRDDSGEAIMDMMPMIDEEFGESLFDASGAPKHKDFRKRYDTRLIPYNEDGSNRDKLGKHKTVADLINADWSLDEYEVQRPSGAYLVDTAPVNTMVLAMTRAGKGQTYIEPVIDIWLRERNPNNMVINDPKGELLVKNYVRATMRGFQVVQFNLINAMKTDIYNPLGMAAEAAREGDGSKCSTYVSNIADVFFPVDGGDDPVWPNAANNAFKRAAFGLIDFYLEEERELRAIAAKTQMPAKVLDTKIDEMWGKVTLYNCYQLFVQLTSKKMKNPGLPIEKRREAREFATAEEYDAAYEESGAALWDSQPEKDMLSLFFSATSALPSNTMRQLIADADNALKAMAGAEKMLASVYGIAITAMSFFTDPTISTLTSGTPSQNTDLGGLSFPRRMGIRFSPNFLKRDSLLGAQAVWTAYGDDMFTEDLGEDFLHMDVVGREGWARYYFKGKFPEQTAYLKLQLKNSQTGMLIRTFYFKFTKDFQTSLNGRYYITDPITDEKIIRNGVLVEMRPVRKRSTNEIVRYRVGNSTFPQMQLTDVTSSAPKKRMGRSQTIMSTMVRYSEQPKAVFLVTPPHLMKYAKLILILVKQLVDLNFDKSYMTKANQKPLYKTRFMLDELGNLQSDGNGISGFETMLSIGLGQEQQFTLILQTLQQLRDVYGESVDKIVQGNVSNIIFLKSTDDSMIDTLQKMSGTRHVSRTKSKSVTKDREKVFQPASVEGKVSYTMTTEEEPVISYNDLAFISERNSIVFRAGNAPIWNRDELILPMSWRLFRDTNGGVNGLVHPGHDYTLQTIPTLSSALEFDVRMNQPDFTKMLSKRMGQAKRAEKALKAYQTAYDLNEDQISRLDPDVHSNEVMSLIDSMNWEEAGGVLAEAVGADDTGELREVDGDELDAVLTMVDEYEENTEVAEAVAQSEASRGPMDRKLFAGGRLSPSMLVQYDGNAYLGSREGNGPFDLEIVEAYKAARTDMERDADWFSTGADGSLRSRDGDEVYISREESSVSMQRMNQLSQDEGSRVFAEGELSEASSYRVHPEFYEFLADQASWKVFARGVFDDAMANAMKAKEDLVMV